MYLLIGDHQNRWCQAVRDALEARGHHAYVTISPLKSSSRLSLRLDNQQTASKLVWLDGLDFPDNPIAGVLVCNPARIESDGWRPKDLAYTFAETQAALLAWLWTLNCPVINRYPSTIWYQPQAPILFWQGLLHRSGLPTIEVLVTNVEQDARLFRQMLTEEGTSGAVYWTLTSNARYLVSSDQEWDQLALMQRYTPVCLARPHGQPQPVCVIGEKIVWEGDPMPTAASIEPALNRFAAALGLGFIELILAQTGNSFSVIGIEPFPNFEHFSEAARRQIVSEITLLLTTQAENGPLRFPASLKGGSP